jgi:hypothetical protein
VLLRRPRDEAAAAGGGIQGIRGGGEGEGVAPPWPPVAQAQVFRHLASLKKKSTAEAAHCDRLADAYFESIVIIETKPLDHLN